MAEKNRPDDTEPEATPPTGDNAAPGSVASPCR